MMTARSRMASLSFFIYVFLSSKKVVQGLTTND